MRGTRAKRLRRMVYGKTDCRERSYKAINQRIVYLTGERKFGTLGNQLRYAFGWPILIYTLLADSRRQCYQRLKSKRGFRLQPLT